MRDVDFFSPPLGEGGTARRWVRGPYVLLVIVVRGPFADDALVGLFERGTLDFDGTLRIPWSRSAPSALLR